MTTTEEIARQAAEALVTVGDWPTGQVWHVVIGGKLLPQHHNSEPIALSHAGEVRGILRAAIQTAIEQALRSVPVPGGLSEREIAGILGVQMALDDAVDVDASILLPDQVRAVRDAFRDLIEDNNHLRRALYDCGLDGSAGIWTAGYEAGTAAGRAREASMAQALRAIRLRAATDPALGEVWGLANVALPAEGTGDGEQDQ